MAPRPVLEQYTVFFWHHCRDGTSINCVVFNDNSFWFFGAVSINEPFYTYAVLLFVCNYRYSEKWTVVGSQPQDRLTAYTIDDVWKRNEDFAAFLLSDSWKVAPALENRSKVNDDRAPLALLWITNPHVRGVSDADLLQELLLLLLLALEEDEKMAIVRVDRIFKKILLVDLFSLE